MTGPLVPDVSPDLPGAHWRATLALLERLPQGALSRAFGRVADVPLPARIRSSVLGAFARAVGIDVDEAEMSLGSYRTLNEFFVRRLRAGARTWPERADVAASPVDGVVGQLGSIHGDALVQAKGRTYSAGDLLGEPSEAARYEGGSFLTIYLSPRHYHRIHAPCSGGIASARHVPGALLPVNEPAVLHVDRLFPRNERLLCTIEGTLGTIAVVAVGAYNVGRISAAFDPEWDGGPAGWITNRPGHRARERRYDPALPVARGDEIMAFHLGSTVVLLFSRGTTLMPLEPGAEIRLGAPIATMSD